MSKGYTLNFFINAFKSTNKVTDAYTAVSPRYGCFSVKAQALDTWLDGQTSSIVRGEGKFASFGKTPRARLLKALKNRKNNGTI